MAAISMQLPDDINQRLQQLRDVLLQQCISQLAIRLK